MSRMKSPGFVQSSSNSKASQHDGFDEDISAFLLTEGVSSIERNIASDYIARSFDRLSSDRQDKLLAALDGNFAAKKIFAASMVGFKRELFKDSKYKKLIMKLLPALDGKTQLAAIKVAERHLDLSKAERAVLARCAVENLEGIGAVPPSRLREERRCLACEVISKTARYLDKSDKPRLAALKLSNPLLKSYLKVARVQRTVSKVPSAAEVMVDGSQDQIRVPDIAGPIQVSGGRDPLDELVLRLRMEAFSPSDLRWKVIKARYSHVS